MWYYINEKNHICGRNANDMSGNSGWIENSNVIVSLNDENGAPLYEFAEGKIIKRTQTEIESNSPEQLTLTEPTLEERIASVEAVVKGTPSYGELLEAVNILLGE